MEVAVAQWEGGQLGAEAAVEKSELESRRMKTQNVFKN